MKRRFGFLMLIWITLRSSADPGYVNFNNTSISTITTNGAVANGKAGGTIPSWYFALLVAPTNQTAVDASLSGWTFVAEGTNTGNAGRMIGFGTLDTSSEVVPGYAAGTQADFAVVAWSANLGSDWNAVYAGRPTTLVSGVGNYGYTESWATVGALPNGGALSPNGQPGAWYGVSTVATNIYLEFVGGPYNSVFGPASVGLIQGMALNFYTVPEPMPVALLAPAAAYVLLRRRPRG